MIEIEDSRVTLTVCGRTDPGRARSENQDSFLVADLSRSAPDGGLLLHPENGGEANAYSVSLGRKGFLAMVADGMGGAAAGGLASRMAISWVYERLATSWLHDRNESPQQFASRLCEAVEEANARIHASTLENRALEGMGTTATVVGVLDGILYIAQVGDSRAYLIRRGRSVQLTRDQSYVQALIDAGQMTSEEAERSVYGSMILQALGTQPKVQVDLTYQPLRRGDTVLICSDGLTRVVRADELGVVADRDADLGARCEALIEEVNERGGPDNVTVVALWVDGEGLDDPTYEDIVDRRQFLLDFS
jgi:PPM family protein phosphatase